jgi:hypothetical protein
MPVHAKEEPNCDEKAITVCLLIIVMLTKCSPWAGAWTRILASTVSSKLHSKSVRQIISSPASCQGE